MKTRLKTIIDYAAKGKHAEFARMMGWKPQYLNSIINGKGSIGLTPVVAILQKFPELDARWLLLGDGVMIHPDIVERTRAHLKKLMELDRYVPAMSPKQLQKYSAGDTDFDADTVADWEKKLQNYCK